MQLRMMHGGFAMEKVEGCWVSWMRDVEEVKKVHSYSQFVDLEYETAGKIISDVIPIEAAVENTNYRMRLHAIALVACAVPFV